MQPLEYLSEAPESFKIPSSHSISALVEPIVGTTPTIFDIAPKGNFVEDFGKDKDLRNLLESLQPKSFSGKGLDVPKVLEE